MGRAKFYLSLEEVSEGPAGEYYVGQAYVGERSSLVWGSATQHKGHKTPEFLFYTPPKDSVFFGPMSAELPDTLEELVQRHALQEAS